MSDRVLGIDATNLRQGGGRTHLVELLRVATPETHGFSRVVVWGSQATLALLDDRHWLVKENPPAQEGGLWSRTLWQRFHLAKAARKTVCNVLFVPGGSYASDFHPFVTMSQNLLPYEWQELRRYGWTLMTLKMLLLQRVQSRTFRLADGVIFLTHYAKACVEHITGALPNNTIIPHGLNERFVLAPRKQKSIKAYSADQPFRILYVSIIDQYKHQWHVVEAVNKLRQTTGWQVTLDLVGPSYPPALRRLKVGIQKHDPEKKWVNYYGAVPFDQLHGIYQQADLGLFASSCENMPNILLETMASGLPVASSNRGPMPEMLADAGVYFDPENPQEIAHALQKMIASQELRTALSCASCAASKQYTWERCARETFDFIAKVAREH